MPLIALRDGTRIEAGQLPPAEWLDLKAAYRSARLTMTCGRPAIPKTSSLGLQYFAHWPDADCRIHEGGPESPAHLAAKAAVARAAEAAGWTATIERLADDQSWIADVMVERNGRRVAFEIQLASQTDANFVRRQTRYEADGVECIWLVNPGNRRSAAGVPSFVVRGGPETFALDASVPGARRRVPLAAAIAGILNDGLQPRPVDLSTPQRGPAREPRRRNPGYETRWEALALIRGQRPNTHRFTEQNWRTPRPVEEMTPKLLAAELEQAFLLLDLGSVASVSASRREQGIYDNLPELLGDFYPAVPATPPAPTPTAAD